MSIVRAAVVQDSPIVFDRKATIEKARFSDRIRSKGHNRESPKLSERGCKPRGRNGSIPRGLCFSLS